MVKPMAVARLKIEDTCILCNVTKKNLLKKGDQGRKMRALWSLQAPNGIGTTFLILMWLLLMVKPLYCQWKIYVL